MKKGTGALTYCRTLLRAYSMYDGGSLSNEKSGPSAITNWDTDSPVFQWVLRDRSVQ